MNRVIQYGTGNVGKHALRAIIERADLDLVGVKVFSDEKVGVDAGSLIGMDDVGVRAVKELDDVLSIDADCVNYNGLGSTLAGGLDQVVDELCVLLRHGFNVTSSSLEQLVHPIIVPEALARLEAACADGGSSFFDVGINPGFAMDLWPITISRVSRTIEQLRVTEVVDMKTYDSVMAGQFMGFGLEPGDRPIDAMHRDSYRSPFYASIRQVADAMRIEIDDIRYDREVAVATEPVEAAIGVLEPGTVAAMKMNFVGIVDGADFLVNSWVWRMSDDVKPEWPTGDKWILEVDGDPEIRSTLEMTTRLDAKRPVSLTVAMLNVNAIPTLCEAAPGVYTNLTLPNFAGGYRPV